MKVFCTTRTFACACWLFSDFSDHCEDIASSMIIIILYRVILVGRDSSVRIATLYGLDGPEIVSRWGKIFRTCSDQLWGPPILPYNRCRVSLSGVKRPGRGVNHLPPSSADVKERVEYTFTSLRVFMAYSRVNFTLTWSYICGISQKRISLLYSRRNYVLAQAVC